MATCSRVVPRAGAPKLLRPLDGAGCESFSLPLNANVGYNGPCLALIPLAGFAVSLIGRFSGVPRGQCLIVYDKFHIMQHANDAVDEVRRAEFFRRGSRMRGLVKGKRWLLLTRWVNLETNKKQMLNELFAINRRLMKAYLLKESRVFRDCSG